MQKMLDNSQKCEYHNNQGGDSMVNIKAIEEEMAKQNISDKDVANAINIDLSTWYRRKSAPSKFQIGEVIAIKSLLNLSNDKASEIFLN